MNSYIEKDALNEALKFTFTGNLSEEHNGTDIWIEAIALVSKVNGRQGYALVKRDKNGEPQIKKSFGTPCMITKIEKIYPFYFLDTEFIPTFKNKAEKIRYIINLSDISQADIDAMTETEIKNILIDICIKQQELKNGRL